MVTDDRVNTNQESQNGDQSGVRSAYVGIFFFGKERKRVSRQQTPGFCHLFNPIGKTELESMQTISNVGVSTGEQSIQSGL